MERDIKERKKGVEIKTRGARPKARRSSAMLNGRRVTATFLKEASKTRQETDRRSPVDQVEDIGESAVSEAGQTVQAGTSKVKSAVQRQIKTRKAARPEQKKTIEAADPVSPKTPEAQMRRVFVEQRKQEAMRRQEQPPVEVHADTPPSTSVSRSHGGGAAPSAGSKPQKSAVPIKEKRITGPAIRERTINSTSIKTKSSSKTAAPKLNVPAKSQSRQSSRGFIAPGRRKAQREAQRQTVQAVKQTAKKAAELTKKAAAAVAKGVSSLISAIVGVVGVSGLLLILCLIVLIMGLASSPFGIFFSGEDTAGDGRTMRVVMREINQEFSDRLTAIENANPYDVLDMGGTMTNWKDVLAIYTVRHSTESDAPIEVATITPDKELYLRTVFWDMNKIDYEVEVQEGETETEEGAEVTETRILHIRITGRTQDEIAAEYGFTARQMTQLAELTDTQFTDAWRNLLYGSSFGSGDIVTVALSQLGNIGGQPYWSWYGFPSRVDWCACFVSWCANECGYIDAGIIPMFSGCTSQGYEWFHGRGQWADRSYTPNPGDLIFFDWDASGDCDHVGIVERVENGRVYTVEGNSGDAVCQQDYPLGWWQIRGYGIPMY